MDELCIIRLQYMSIKLLFSPLFSNMCQKYCKKSDVLLQHEDVLQKVDMMNYIQTYISSFILCTYRSMLCI